MLEAVNGVPVAVQHEAEGAAKGEPRCGGSDGTEVDHPLCYGLSLHGDDVRSP